MAASTSRLNDLDDYQFDFDDDDPFREKTPDQLSKEQDNSKKRKTDGLGIDEEVDVAKKARVPRVKLDETRLLSEDGIPKLRKRAGNLKLKGKGHEFSDAARLLSFYQFWLDDLFPKAKFLDALKMVEKSGHKRILVSKRQEWIDETKPKSSVVADGGDVFEEGDDAAGAADANNSSTSLNGAAVNGTAASRKTPAPSTGDDVPDDDDLFGATPIRPKPKLPVESGAPDDEDDLDALMAEAEMDTSRQRPDQRQQKDAAGDDEDGDDLDALMAEAEADGQRQTSKRPSAQETDVRPPQNEFEDDEAAMAEMGGLW